MKNWVTKKLDEVCDLITCGVAAKPDYVDDGIPFLSAKNVKEGQIIWSGYNCISEKTHKELTKNNKPLLGDILYTRVGSYGEAAVIEDDNEFSVFVSLTLIKVDKTVLNNYFLKHYLNSDFVKRLAKKSISSSGVGNLNVGTVREFPILVPPLPEQQRIVAILDEAFAAIAKAKANAEQNLKNAKELFESYLQGVFENKGEGWVNTTIGETCNLQTGGTPSTSKKEFYEGGKIKWLVSGDINQKIINDCEGRINDLGMSSSNTKYLPVNSVLIALNGQGKTRGTVAMLRTKATCNQSLVSIFPKDEKSLIPELVFSNLEGRYDEIRKITGDSGNDRRGLNMPLIRSIKFSYPKKLSEQKEIISKLGNLRAETKKLEAIYQKKINDLEELKKSVLQKAFSGELTSTSSVTKEIAIKV
jgi:type I restriction enzyme S subunit